MTQDLKIVLVGTSSTLRILQQIAKLPRCQIIRVLVPDHANKAINSLGTAATAMGLDTAPARLVKEPSFADTLREWRTDLLYCARSPFIFCNPVIAAPRIGTINLHTGPLPEYAGRNVISWSLLNQEPTHGVTLHWMEEEIDAGPIAYQQRFPLTPHDTGVSVTGKCIRAACQLTEKLIEDANQDPPSVPRIQQDFAGRRYYNRDVPNDGWIDFEWTASRIEAFVRASNFFPFRSPWGTPQFALRGRTYGCLKAVANDAAACVNQPGVVLRSEGEGVVVQCGQGELRLEELLDEGERISPSDVLAPADRLEFRSSGSQV